MKIRITMIAILLATMISLSACGSNASSNDSVVETETYGFVVVSKQNIGTSNLSRYLVIMYDPDTLVMYAVTFGTGIGSNTSQLTALYNADGTLKTYNPNTESN